MDFTYGLADNSYRTQIFYNSGEYSIPKGVTSLLIIAIGAGGGGGGGFTRSSGAGGGGGGGATGETARILIPGIFLSDSLKIHIGAGGTPGAANQAGGLGNTTFVDMTMSQPSALSGINRTISTRVITAQGGFGGLAGTLSDGAGGTAASASTSGSMSIASLGTFTTRAGIAGGSGNGAGIYGTGSSPLSSGRGGGNISAANAESAGGSISGRGFVADVPGGAIRANGQNGSLKLKPFITLAGTGGGSFHLGLGGSGGYGGPGCGGGGGGSGATGGSGGKGGDGLVIITCI